VQMSGDNLAPARQAKREIVDSPLPWAVGLGFCRVPEAPAHPADTTNLSVFGPLRQSVVFPV